MNEPRNADRPIQVLLVDDHPVVRDGYRRLLETMPDIRVVAEAGDGEMACALYDQCQPDVVVLDLSMPGMGGLEVLRRLKARDASARVLIFSMHDSETMIQRALEAGATGYLTKNGGMGQMVEAVRTVACGNPFIDPERVLEVAVRQVAHGGDDPLRVLSSREFQLFRLFAEGQTVAEIAEDLSISPKTVGVHYTNIMKKLRLQNAAQLVRLAIRSKVIQA
ncbi:MAG: response regulator transcription factor [Rhodocyclaceae bacterium]|nr:response regulator transcription factor [Rhodocyclaceae bacterium]